MVNTIDTADVMSVKSRVTWGPILAGAVIAMGIYMVLTLLGIAIGLSVGDRVSGQAMGTAAGIWAIATTIVSLFIGGVMASQFTAGENKMEGALYGFLVWGVVFAAIMWMVSMGISAGFSGMVSLAGAAQKTNGNMTQVDWEQSARQAGINPERIEEWKRQAKTAPDAARDAVNDPANQKAAYEVTNRAAWFSLLGLVGSMLSAVVGGRLGAGPEFRLLPVARTMNTRPVMQEIR